MIKFLRNSKLLLLIPAVIFICCGAKAQTKPATKTVAKTAPSANTPSIDVAQGKVLLPKYDCLACHKLKEKLIGPSYTDVAKKYKNTPATVNMLTKKIISGGTGVWGTNAMAAHPNLSAKDAGKMVDYILSLK